MTARRLPKGLGRTRIERATRLARRMWKLYMRYGWHEFTWPGVAMHEAVERSNR